MKKQQIKGLQINFCKKNGDVILKGDITLEAIEGLIETHSNTHEEIIEMFYKALCDDIIERSLSVPELIVLSLVSDEDEILYKTAINKTDLSTVKKIARDSGKNDNLISTMFIALMKEYKKNAKQN